MGGMAIRQKLVKSQAWLIFLLVILIACVPLQSAGAQSSNPNGLVPAGETLQGSQFIFAPQINIEGIVDGDVFAIGQDVIVKGEIKGSLFLLSNTATIDGTLEGDLFAANTRLTLGSTSSIGRSAYILAGLVNMLPGSVVGHDLYLIALGGEISGSVGRYQRAHVGFLEVLNLLLGENGLLQPLMPPGFQLPLSTIDFFAGRPAGRVFIWSSAASGSGLSALGLPMILQSQLQAPEFDSAAVTDWLVVRLRAFAPLFLIGLLLLWLFPGFLQGSTERLRARPLASFGFGIVVFFVGVGAATLTLALVAALGMFFATVQYWDLAMITWSAGLGGLSVGLALFSLAIIYLSKIIIAYLFGIILLKRMSPSTWGRRVWMLLLGEVIVVLLLSIPILDWVLSVLATMFGLGAIYLYLRQRAQPAGASAQDLPAPNTEVPSALEAPADPIVHIDDTITVEPEVAPVTASPEIVDDVAETLENAADV
jgi:hypothetical protein